MDETNRERSRRGVEDTQHLADLIPPYLDVFDLLGEDEPNFTASSETSSASWRSSIRRRAARRAKKSSAPAKSLRRCFAPAR